MSNNRSSPQIVTEYVLNTIKRNEIETVEELIQLVQEKFSISPDEALKYILRLQREGKLLLDEEPIQPYSTMKGYILSSKAHWYWAIIAIAFATTILTFTVPENFYPIVYARYLMGGLFIFILPGFSLSKLLFRNNEFDNIELVALSIGMSLAMLSITGFLLNYTPWGIRVMPLTLALLTLTTTLATFAIIRNQRATISAREKLVSIS